MNNTTGNVSWTLNLNATRPAAVCSSIPCLFTTTELVVISICSFLVILVGIIANVFTGIVLIASKTLRTISNFSILSLIVADLLLSIFVAPFMIISVFLVKGWVFGTVMCKLNIFIQRVAVCATLLNLLVVSLERFLAVCFPFFLRVRKKLFLYAIILVWIVAIAISIPDLFYRRLVRQKTDEFCFYEESAQAKLFKSSHDVFFFAVVAIMLPIQMITICCLRIKGKALRNNSKANYVRRRNACCMLFMLMISCIVCWFPLKISAMILGNKKAGEKLGFKTINIVLVVTLVLYYSCTVIHPIIFFFLSPKGKRMVNAILRKAKKQNMRKRGDKLKKTTESERKTSLLMSLLSLRNRTRDTIVNKETSC